MAGTLTLSTLSDGTNSTSATNPILGSAKAWVNFNGTGTVAINGSFNVSSITDNGTGNYTVNFTNAMPNANYSTTLTSEVGVGTGNKGPYLSSLAASNFSIFIFNSSGSFVDATPICAAVFSS
jgi:hypothetical protein